MSFLGQLSSLIFPSKSTPEGAFHEGPWHITTTSSPGWLPAEWGAWNHWQMNQDPRSGAGINAMVEACVSAYAQTVAMCPMAHWERLDNGGREQVTTSALSRIAIVPNDYETRSDFLLNLVRALYLDGNAYALALRNNRFEISSLHGMNPRMCRAEVVDGEIFYELGGNPVIDGRIEALGLGPALRFVPARDVLHVKLNSVIDVLHGETPLCAAALAVASNNAMQKQSLSFSANQSRPSGVLSTDLTLAKPKVDELRQLWNEHSKGLNAGGVPILSSGLKFQPMTISNRDAQAIEILKANDAMIAQVFRVPLAIVGSEQQPMGSTEALMQFWIAGGLGFALDRVELAFDKLFGLPSTEYSELDSSVLLRSNLKDKVEAFARSTIAGIHAPNEARAEFELPAVKWGEEPRVQQQVVPLSFASEPPAPPAAPAALATPPPPSSSPPPPDQQQQADVAALVRQSARLGRIDAMLSGPLS